MEGVCQTSCSLGAQEGLVLGRLYVKVRQCGLGILRAGQEDFVPEEGLHGVEVKSRLSQEGHIAVFCPHVALAHAVDEKHVLRRKLQAPHLYAQSAQGELHHVVALHAKRAAHGHVGHRTDSIARQLESHLGRQAARALGCTEHTCLVGCRLFGGRGRAFGGGDWSVRICCHRASGTARAKG